MAYVLHNATQNICIPLDSVTIRSYPFYELPTMCLSNLQVSPQHVAPSYTELQTHTLQHTFASSDKRHKDTQPQAIPTEKTETVVHSHEYSVCTTAQNTCSVTTARISSSHGLIDIKSQPGAPSNHPAAVCIASNCLPHKRHGRTRRRERGSAQEHGEDTPGLRGIRQLQIDRHDIH